MRVQITAAILCSMVMMVHAAPDEGIITGRVVDLSGRRVADVEVALYGPEVSKDAVTDAQGAYAFGGLDEGRYLVVVEGPGHGEDLGGGRHPGAT